MPEPALCMYMHVSILITGLSVLFLALRDLHRRSNSNAGVWVLKFFLAQEFFDALLINAKV